MARNRKRQGHRHHKTVAGPSHRRSKAPVVMAVLFGVFGLLTSVFAFAAEPVALAATTLAGAGIGYLVGKNMEAAASGKKG